MAVFCVTQNDLRRGYGALNRIERGELLSFFVYVTFSPYPEFKQYNVSQIL